MRGVVWIRDERGSVDLRRARLVLFRTTSLAIRGPLMLAWYYACLSHPCVFWQNDRGGPPSQGTI